jgi:transcriptional regulator with XRE-family HTH domain
METASPLAAFLRARRELLKPADVGLPDSERRRVEGLRREEVAMLAGISTEYYLKLEQGRDHQPSDQVLEGLARALQLDDDAASYLRELARPVPPRHRRSAPEKFDPTVQTLIDSWLLTPAFVINRNMRILASNGVARVLSPSSLQAKTSCAPRFSSPSYACSTETGTSSRLGSSPLPEQCSERSLPIANIGELSIASKRFATLWARHDVKHRSTGPAAFYHPQVGPLDLHYAMLHLPDQHQILVTYHADPDSPSEEGLRLLASLAP